MSDLEKLENFRRAKMKLNLREIDKLEKMLQEAGETYERTDMGSGVQIVVLKDGHRKWDAEITVLSHGHEDGLLEVMGAPVVDRERDGGNVVGNLTAEEVMERAKGRRH